MHLRIATTRNGLLALAVIAALFSSAPAALAGHGNGRGNGRGHNKEYGRGAYRGGGYTAQRWRTPQRVYAQRPTYYRQSPRISANVRIYSGGSYGGSYYQPTYVRCAPRYVTYRPQRVVIVRPAPYVRIGGVFGSVGISAVFGPRRHYSSYDYGCNFCDAHFSSYGAYESHVQSCAYRPADVRIQCQNWDDQGYNDYRSSGDYDEGYDQGYRSNDDDNGYRGNDGYDDRGDDYDDGN
jgi:hypothetical protein